MEIEVLASSVIVGVREKYFGLKLKVFKKTLNYYIVTVKSQVGVLLEIIGVRKNTPYDRFWPTMNSYLPN